MMNVGDVGDTLVISKRISIDVKQGTECVLLNQESEFIFNVELSDGRTIKVHKKYLRRIK